VTSDCFDPQYSLISIDSESEQLEPMPHYRITAHFDNTAISINLYFPPKDQWRGRFFQYVYPTNPPNATDTNIRFAIDSGAYWIQVTGTIGYRADAAVAKFSRLRAFDHYNLTSTRIYGYIFGGSGGSFQTIGAIENTEGVWDGAVAFIQAVPVSNPTNFCARALAGLALRDKAKQIIEAVSPGGHGDPYAGLTEYQRSAFQEATLMGVPLHSWEDFDRVGGTRSLRLLNISYRTNDPTYKNDFWSLPGYLGTELSELGDVIRAALVNGSTEITQVVVGDDGAPTSMILASLPAMTTTEGLDFTIYDRTGTTELGIVWGELNLATKTLSLYKASNSTAISALEEGLRVQIDNGFSLAMHSYHRHQLPAQDGFYSFNQFRDAAGSPLYPQRSMNLATRLATSTSGGGTHTGNITGKLIVVDNLLDSDAYPWHADWYRNQVKSVLGESLDDNYRLWFNEHTNHDYEIAVPAAQSSQLVPFEGMIEHALRDLADWVETGIQPPKSTNYTLNGAQVSISNAVGERYGIQPAVSLTVNANTSAVVGIGDTVFFKAYVAVTDNNSKIVSVEWDLLGSGELVPYPISAPPNASIEIELQSSYNASGTYFPAIRVTSQREGNPTSPFARTLNLGRARVVVE
jgi:hypothetical protein